MKSNYVLLRNKNPALSIFDEDWILNRELLNLLQKYSLGDVLDYGAGNSPWQESLIYQNYKRADVQQNLKENIDYIVLKKTPLPVLDETFDSILLMDVLEHIEDFEFVLSDLYRMLKKGGRLFISVPFLYREHETPNDYYRFTSYGVRKILKQKHFSVTLCKKIGNHLLTIYSLWNEAMIKKNEKFNGSLLSKIIRKLILFLILPLLNLTIFKNPPKKDDSVFHHLFLVAKK